MRLVLLGPDESAPIWVVLQSPNLPFAVHGAEITVLLHVWHKEKSDEVNLDLDEGSQVLL